MKTVCLFSIHRTGTNYLGSVLKQWPEVAAFGEIFHPKQVYGLKPAHWKAISNVAGQTFDDAEDPAFVAWARANPVAMVDVLRRVARRKDKAGIYFKVFVGQWTVPVAATIAALAREPGFVPVLLQRRCLDVYVSFRKAEAAGSYKHVDTTDVAVTLDPDAYARWAADARRWYREVDAALAAAGAAPVRATYERDIDGMPAEALSAHWSTLLGLPAAPALDASTVLGRQDRNDDLAAKIANHDAFLDGLRERGLLAEALSVFLPGGESLVGRAGTGA